MRTLLRRPSPAMVVACLALLVALGGTSIAAVSQLVPRNSVGTAQLQFGAVTNQKIRNNAINSAKIANRSLLRSDFAVGQLPAGPVGPQGPAGPTGAAGAAGAAGPAGVIGTITVRSSSALVDGGTAENSAYNSVRVTALCQGNERAISGGTSWSDDTAGRELMTGELEPQLNAQNQVIGFLGVGLNDSGNSSTFTVHALCYTP
ncbi:MAG: hypothetical protein ACRDOF_02365 [Gaiellaceae bacterium]